LAIRKSQTIQPKILEKKRTTNDLGNVKLKGRKYKKYPAKAEAVQCVFSATRTPAGKQSSGAPTTPVKTQYSLNRENATPPSVQRKAAEEGESANDKSVSRRKKRHVQESSGKKERTKAWH